MKNPFRSSVTRLSLDSLLALAFFSPLTSFVEATYSFGLLGTDIPPEIVYVLFLISPVLLLMVPRMLDSRAFALVTGAFGLLSWAFSLTLDTRWRMLATGLGCGLLLLFLPARVRQSTSGASGLAAGLGIGVLLTVLLRSLHSGTMMLSSGPSLLLGAILAAVAVFLLLVIPREIEGPPRDATGGPGFWPSLVLSLGIFSAIALLYFGFTSPAVIARWGEASYPMVTAAQAGAAALFAGLWLGPPSFRARLAPRALQAWNALFLLALAYTLLSRQPAFSPSTVYPLYAPAPGLPARIAFWAMLMLHPVIYVDIARMVGALRTGRTSPRALAGAAAVGALLLLLLTFAQIFTTVYDYIPVVGPLFRDRFWLVVSVPALVMTLGTLRLGREGIEEHLPSALRMTGALSAVVLAAGALLVSGLTGAHPAVAQPESSLRILTWNIQQGYGKTGEKSVDRQIETIRRMKPDLLGLQETDTARIAGGNSDVIRAMADTLDMYSYYGPAPESGTFGIALLSRYPIEDPRTFFMPSKGEQTAAIEAWVPIGRKLIRVLVTHLDNDGAVSQQRVLLQRASSGASVAAVIVAMGDFNFNPSTEQYRLTTATLADAWVQADRRMVQPGASEPGNRIDHIFLSRGTRVAQCEYLAEGPSDHPAMCAEIKW